MTNPVARLRGSWLPVTHQGAPKYKSSTPSHPRWHPNFPLTSLYRLTHCTMNAEAHSPSLSTANHELESPPSPSIYLDTETSAGATAAEAQAISLEPLSTYPLDIPGRDAESIDRASDGIAGGANDHESIDAFLNPLEFLPCSDADIACVDVPSSDFDWSAAFHAATTSPSDSATTVLHLRRPWSNTRVFRARHPKRSSRRRQYKIYGSTATVELGDDALAEVLAFTWNPASRRWHGPGKMEVRDLVEYIKGRLTKNGRRRLISSLMYDTYRRVAVTVRQGSRRKIQLRFDDALGAWEGRCGSGRIQIGLGGLKRMLHGEATWADASR